MAKIIPFQGYKYNPDVVRNMQELVTPPFDLISSNEQEQLYQASPYNMIRLNLGKQFQQDIETDNRYTRSAKTLQEWIQAKVLIPSPTLSLYVYTIQLAGNPIPLIGFIGLVELQEFSSRQILPHENTLRAPVEDRVKLVTECQSYFDPIFVLYQENKGIARNIIKQWIANREPEISIWDEFAALHKLWTLDDQKIITQILGSLAPNPVMIADGHHRYTAALHYRAEQKKNNPNHTGSEPYNYTLMFLADLEDPGLQILPTHRTLKNLSEEIIRQVPGLFSEDFAINEISFPQDNRKELIEKVRMQMREAGQRNQIIFGLYTGGEKFYWLTLKGKPAEPELDVSLFNQKILEKALGISQEDIFSGDYLRYTKDSQTAIQAVDTGKMQLAFLLNPVKIEQVKQIVLRGERMPQKSTYFIPKPLTGLVIYSFSNK
ncbi:MAG: DUF1015 domain-containing protein [bacterium]|nr:DUF1015 domain-containing protein [bacterium]